VKAKLTRGTGFGGVIDYVFSEKKDAKIVGGNMPGVDARQLRQEFGAVRAQRPDIEMPVWHCSLSLPAGERLSDERWEEVTQKYMQGMGFSEAHPYTVVRHSDTDHDHVHIIASRIAVGAELWYGQHELPKAIRLTQELEAEFGLVRTPIVGEKDNFSPLTAQENRIAERKGEYPPKYKLQDIIEDFFKQEDLSVSSFCSFLEKENVDIRANISKTGKMNGFSYKLGDVSYKSSSLGRAYTFDQLVRSGLDYVPSRDFQLLQRYAPSPDSTSENSSSPNTITAAFPADDRRKTARAQLRKILDEEVKKKTYGRRYVPPSQLRWRRRDAQRGQDGEAQRIFVPSSERRDSSRIRDRAGLWVETACHTRSRIYASRARESPLRSGRR
jgi:hypothetical protein